MTGKIGSLFCFLFAGLLFVATVGYAEEEVKITPVKITDQIYMITGKGGNIGLFVGKDGTFMIDDQFAPLTEQILSVIGSVGGDHPRFLINTHYHGDHTGGNEKLGREGTLIFSHHNVRDRLKMGSFIEAFKMKGEPTAPEGLPVVTFSKDLSFHFEGNTITARHVPHAHTDGDCFIHFREANVIHAGDFFFNGLYPFIDVGHGGSLKGMITAVDKVLALSDEKTKIIGGHGPLGDKKQLTAFRVMLATAYERLGKLKAEGKSAAEAVAEKPLADLEETWGKGMFTGDRWIELIYPGV
ncbi:MAG: MBL fold metallo-hydrolase [Proteobacteria bacterium]|nr:MBL fold metallo-hydrolase [Pseudomonadota bacterium]MBU1738646.1 MBL fold metallo-hydrolase [Pseudomonadota bacterium]